MPDLLRPAQCPVLCRDFWGVHCLAYNELDPKSEPKLRAAAGKAGKLEGFLRSSVPRLFHGAKGSYI